MNHLHSFFLVLTAMIVLPNKVLAQVQIDTSHNAAYWVKQVLLAEESGVEVSKVHFKGAKQSLGSFKNKWTSLVMPEGIIISSGDVMGAAGPNDNPKMSSVIYPFPDRDLQKIATGEVFDAAVLEFDLVAQYDSLSFGFVFASEEYPEYVNKGVNDIFAFWITNRETGFKRNLALLQPDNEPVMVDNINAEKHPELFIQNGIWEEDNIRKWENNKTLGELAYAFQYDGFTRLLKAQTRVVPGETYHLKIAIADVGDRRYDSAVMLEAYSLRSQPSEESQQKLENRLAADLAEKFSGLPGEIQADSDQVSISLPILFRTNSDQISDDQSMDYLKQIVQVLLDQPDSKLRVVGHTDRVGTDAYNQDLSERRAQKVAEFLISRGVQISRVQWEGKGASEPIASNDDDNGRSRNRRVEFIFVPEGN
ncbi:OmpA family protein [bacterium SCSIO 12741]|nr:OmpA family protein [bacterium SCSIO 12741]